MNFTTYAGKDSAFKQSVSIAAFAQAIKTAQNVPTVHFSNILGTAEKKFAICTLSDGRSCTMPVSKKATLGNSVAGMYAAEANDGTWVLTTSQHGEGTTF